MIHQVEAKRSAKTQPYEMQAFNNSLKVKNGLRSLLVCRL